MTDQAKRAAMVAGGTMLALGLLAVPVSTTVDAAGPDWAVNATAIEACSCPMFCQCYFATEPAAHHHEGGSKHFCRANLAYKVNRGHHGEVKLDGVNFWVASDLGHDFSKGQMDWAVMYFDKAMTKPQRDVLLTIFEHVFPVKWKSFTTAEAGIDTWGFDKDSARAPWTAARPPRSV